MMLGSVITETIIGSNPHAAHGSGSTSKMLRRSRTTLQGSESGCEIQPACGSRELRVERPQFRGCQRRSRQEVRIDPADAGAHQAVSLDELEDFVVGRGYGRGEFA